MDNRIIGYWALFFCEIMLIFSCIVVLKMNNLWQMFYFGILTVFLLTFGYLMGNKTVITGFNEVKKNG